MSHCPTCTCEEVVLHLPMNYFPPGHSITHVGGETLVVNRHGDYDYYWTKRYNDDTRGYDRIVFENQENL